MRAQVVVGAVGDALDFLVPQRGVVVHQVVGALGVVREVFFGHVQNLDLAARHALVFPPLQTLFQPVLVPLLVGAGHDEELDFHLLQLAHAENEVARRDLVAKRLANLGDAEGQAAAGGVHHVLEVSKYPLRGFGAQVAVGLLVGDRADGRLEHHVERLGVGPVAHLAGKGVTHARVLERRRSLRGLGIERGHQRSKVVRTFTHDFGDFGLHVGLLVFEQVVEAVALVVLLVVDHGVGKGRLVPRVPQHHAVHDDGGVQPFHVVALVHVGAPPRRLDVVFQLHTEGAVVIEPLQAAVNLGPLKNKAPAFAQADEFFH